MNAERYLVDTSVWLEVLPPDRGTGALRQRIDELLAADRVATTGMIRLELLGGARTQEEWRRLRDLLSALHLLPVDEDHWDEASQLGFRLRRQGIAVPFTDLLVGAVAMRDGAVVLHRDRHFDLMAAHVSLKVESRVTM
ncbi:MAG: PIN domain nuclease [SAR202 cluster bacterium]|nr:PIN domain nuclease [SAR202 cluster bacterium]